MVITRDGVRTIPWSPHRTARQEQRRTEAPIELHAPLPDKGPRPYCDSNRNHQDSRAAVTTAGIGERHQKDGGATAACEPWFSPSGRRSEKKKSNGVAGAK